MTVASKLKRQNQRERFQTLLPAFYFFSNSEKITLSCRTQFNKLIPNLQRKHNINAKSTNLEENAGKIKSVLSSEQPCEPKSLDVALDIAGGERNLRLRSTRFEFSLEAGAILCSLLCSEWNWNIRVGKQVYGICFIPDINLCQQLF